MATLLYVCISANYFTSSNLNAAKNQLFMLLCYKYDTNIK